MRAFMRACDEVGVCVPLCARDRDTVPACARACDGLMVARLACARTDTVPSIAIVARERRSISRMVKARQRKELAYFIFGENSFFSLENTFYHHL